MQEIDHNGLSDLLDPLRTTRKTQTLPLIELLYAMNDENARDEHFWHAIAQRYDVAPGPINLENGYFGRMTHTVAQDYQPALSTLLTAATQCMCARSSMKPKPEIRESAKLELLVEHTSISPHQLRVGCFAIGDSYTTACSPAISY